MPQNPKVQTKRKQALKTYYKVYKSVKKFAEKNDLQWSVKEVREFTKNNVYPDFKGEKSYQVRVRDIKAVIQTQLQAQNPPPTPIIEGVQSSQIYYNPLLISPSRTTGILWFDIDDYLSVDLFSEVSPLDLRVEVNAGEYGSTGIFDLLNYQYEFTGLNEIIESIRESLEDDSEPEWVGQPVVREGFTDDGQTDSYFLRFTLYIGGNEVPPTFTAEISTTEIPLPQETLEQRRARRKEITLAKKERAKVRRQAMKEKEARKRPRPTKKEKPTLEPKTSQETRTKNVQEALEREKEMLAESERLFREGILTKEEFTAERKEIMATTKLAISKFKDGGVV
jgi:hypothetical protein